MSSKIAVVHIAPTPFFADRGCHIRIRNEIESLRHSTYRIILCTYHHGSPVSGMDIRRIWPVPGYTKLTAGYSPFRFIADLLLFFLVLKTVWQERPALLHGHLHEGALIGWAVSKCLFWRRLPVIMDMQGSLSGELAAYKAFGSLSFPLRLFKVLERLICRMPDCFLCSSRQSMSCLREEFHVPVERILLLEDMVPDSFFAPDTASDQKGRIPTGKSVIIYTGSLLPGKGVEYLLNAMRSLCAERDDLHFVLVGYPEEEARCYAAAHNLADRCLLPGQIRYADLVSWLALGDIAVEPKAAEAGEASGKLLHYMAAGLPVVCFDTPNNRSMLGAAGCYAPSSDAQGLSAGIRAALADMDAARCRGKKGRKLVRERYSAAAVSRSLERLYRRLAQVF
jgi:glycosyltransferase involved in cell wall biosynthesis